MSPTPTGPIGAPLLAASTLLASLESWQTMCGVAAEDLGSDEAVATAAGHVYFPGVELAGLSVAQRQALRPLAVLAIGEGASARRVAAPNTWEDRVPLWLAVRALPDDEYEDRDDQYVSFINAIGAVEAELRTASGIGTINIVQIDRVRGPARPRPKEVNKSILDEYSVEYALEAEG